MNEIKRNVTTTLTKIGQSHKAEEVTINIDKPVTSNTSKETKSKPLAMIGPSIHFKGELTGEEGLIIDGSIEGTINLKGNSLIVGENGRILADVFANTIKVDGYLKGELHGVEKVHISRNGEVKGNIFSPRVIIEDGAKFKGSIDMTSKVIEQSVNSNISTGSEVKESTLKSA
ncbi:MAG: polymer-forming cytoskeletal protein [Gammaproteobacteria bacterium]|nr:polymer-forming cytoskeletal protein [Gammaproteobacteria bacterium]